MIVKNFPGECKKPEECLEIAIVKNLTEPSWEDLAFVRNRHKICGMRGNIPYVCCSILPKPGQCGVQLTDKIHGGTEAKIKEFPWTAMLMYQTCERLKEFMLTELNKTLTF